VSTHGERFSVRAGARRRRDVRWHAGYRRHFSFAVRTIGDDYYLLAQDTQNPAVHNFRDRTNGRETYGGGRFLHAPLPQDGVTTLDFNKAFNPFCSVNDYVACPVVPAENRLGLSVAAGQKYYGGESH